MKTYIKILLSDENGEPDPKTHAAFYVLLLMTVLTIGDFLGFTVNETIYMTNAGFTAGCLGIKGIEKIKGYGSRNTKEKL